ncbi:hypothetical protein AAHE18_13G152800 [Arachis hypogaea]
MPHAILLLLIYLLAPPSAAAKTLWRQLRAAPAHLLPCQFSNPRRQVRLRRRIGLRWRCPLHGPDHSERAAAHVGLWRSSDPRHLPRRSVSPRLLHNLAGIPRYPVELSRRK